MERAIGPSNDFVFANIDFPRIVIGAVDISFAVGLLTSESGRLWRSFGAANAIAVAFFAGVSLERLLLDWWRQRRARWTRRVRPERLAAAEEHSLKRCCVRVAAAAGWRVNCT